MSCRLLTSPVYRWRNRLGAILVICHAWSMQPGSGGLTLETGGSDSSPAQLWLATRSAWFQPGWGSLGQVTPSGSGSFSATVRHSCKIPRSCTQMLPACPSWLTLVLELHQPRRGQHGPKQVQASLQHLKELRKMGPRHPGPGVPVVLCSSASARPQGGPSVPQLSLKPLQGQQASWEG